MTRDYAQEEVVLELAERGYERPVLSLWDTTLIPLTAETTAAMGRALSKPPCTVATREGW